ncbi:MAG TPA: isocitrate lyase/phosphoenolpyruvate mutase family protein [Thermomicrobiaceae bacterium]|nr:isocitrate lyase/phosphoenolpyruvate mutase family protein [Thermomicrobiaceae bacterium]
MNQPATQREKADALRDLHAHPPALVLVNAWDAASARIVEQAGCRAVATSSSSMSWSLGFPDGESVGRDAFLADVRRITQAVSVPVTVDYLAGFGLTIDDLAASVRDLLTTGAVGLNIEDTTGDPARPFYTVEEQVARIRTVREVAEVTGVPLVINARTDVYARPGGPEDARLSEAIRRVNAYRAAGADCLLVLGAVDEPVIDRLVREATGPLNVLAGPRTPSVGRLAELGVARISTGGGPGGAAYGTLREVAREVLERGTFETIATRAIPHGEMNRLFMEG